MKPLFANVPTIKHLLRNVNVEFSEFCIFTMRALAATCQAHRLPNCQPEAAASRSSIMCTRNQAIVERFERLLRHIRDPMLYELEGNCIWSDMVETVTGLLGSLFSLTRSKRAVRDPLTNADFTLKRS